MATVSNFNIDDKEKQPDDNKPSGGVTLGSGQESTTGQRTTSQPNTIGAPTSSGRFTNLNQYLNANKNFNQQGGGLAGKITSNVEKQTTGVQNQFGQAQQEFQNQANQNRVQYNEGLVNNATQNAAQFANDPNNIQQFTQQRDASYQGPQAINSAQIDSQTGRLQTLAQLGQTDRDRPELLKQLYRNPQYTAGQQSLDNLLLQSNQGQLQALQKLNPLTQNLASTVSSGEDAARQMASQYGQEALDTRTKTRDALGNVINQFGSQADQAVKDASAKRDADYQQALTQLGQGQISKNDLQKFGLNEGTNLYNLDLGSYLSKNNFTPTAQNVIDQNQAAQIGALSKLSGNALTGDPTKVLQQFQDLSHAGEYAKQNEYNLDKDRFNADLNQTQQAYNFQSGEQQKAIDQSQAALAGLQPQMDAYAKLLAPYNGQTIQTGPMGNEQQIQLNNWIKQNNDVNSQYGAETNKLSSAQQALQNIINQYNPNRKLSVV